MMAISMTYDYKKGEFDMPGKSVPVSLRLSEADAEFIATTSMLGAVTPSDKIRVLIKEARQRHAGASDYLESLKFYHGLLAPTLQREHVVEEAQAAHSELLIQFSNLLPEILAYVTANMPESGAKDAMERMTALEKGVADRLFGLFQQMLRLAVTGRSPCYDEAVIIDRLEPILELCDLIKASTKRGKEKSK